MYSGNQTPQASYNIGQAPPTSYTIGQTQKASLTLTKPSGQSQSQYLIEQAQYSTDQAQVAQQSECYQNVQVLQKASQQETRAGKVSELENTRHLEQLNKSQMQSVETSADNIVQIQRTKRCTEEFERTQKSKIIEIQRSGAESR